MPRTLIRNSSTLVFLIIDGRYAALVVLMSVRICLITEQRYDIPVNIDFPSNQTETVDDYEAHIVSPAVKFEDPITDEH